MKIVQLKCPSCGSSLEAQDSLETFYCQYCGQKIVLSEQSNAVIGAKVIGRILEHREHMHQMKMEEQRVLREEALKERKRNERVVWIGILAFILLAALLFLLAYLMERNII